MDAKERLKRIKHTPFHVGSSQRQCQRPVSFSEPLDLFASWCPSLNINNTNTVCCLFTADIWSRPNLFAVFASFAFQMMPSSCENWLSLCNEPLPSWKMDEELVRELMGISPKLDT